ncbi:TPA: hypothetical protein ACXJYT_005913, partial [Pseudomonas aeruginosa]
TANPSLKFDSSSFITSLPIRYTFKNKKNSNTISVSTDDFSFSNWLEFENNAYSFLKGLTLMTNEEEISNLIFRIAIYYNTDETVIFPFHLSKKMINKIHKMKLSVEINGYPSTN